MLDPISRDLNRANLIEMSEILFDIEHFAFFGTVLGLNRESDIIENDDDIDFLLDFNNRDALINRLKNSPLDIDLEKPLNKTNFFLQATREQGGVETFVDFYFYENNAAADFIVERWNFFGRVEDPTFAIHIPKKFVFPISKEEYFGVKVNVPHNKDAICEFLYGPNWRNPLKKKSGYKTIIFNHKPVLFQSAVGIFFSDILLIYKNKPIYRLDLYVLFILKKFFRLFLTKKKFEEIRNFFNSFKKKKKMS
jgi:hypothetical protein